MTSWPLAGASAVSIELYRQLEISRGVTAVIGSGGKTSLIAFLARTLPGTVIVCTSTHIYPAAGMPLLERISVMPARRVCVGTAAAHGKLTAPLQPFEELAQLADYVLVEADGSRGLPLKAHLPYEPVIPPCTGQTIQAVGLTGLGQPIRRAAHRSAQYAALCGCREEDPATPERAARVLNSEALADRYVLNQADNPERQALAADLSVRLSAPAAVTCLQQMVFKLSE